MIGVYFLGELGWGARMARLDLSTLRELSSVIV
jgi:hypothetical protein